MGRHLITQVLETEDRARAKKSSKSCTNAEQYKSSKCQLKFLVKLSSRLPLITKTNNWIKLYVLFHVLSLKFLLLHSNWTLGCRQQNQQGHLKSIDHVLNLSKWWQACIMFFQIYPYLYWLYFQTLLSWNYKKLNAVGRIV